MLHDNLGKSSVESSLDESVSELEFWILSILKRWNTIVELDGDLVPGSSGHSSWNIMFSNGGLDVILIFRDEVEIVSNHFKNSVVNLVNRRDPW